MGHGSLPRGRSHDAGMLLDVARARACWKATQVMLLDATTALMAVKPYSVDSNSLVTPPVARPVLAATMPPAQQHHRPRQVYVGPRHMQVSRQGQPHGSMRRKCRLVMPLLLYCPPHSHAQAQGSGR